MIDRNGHAKISGFRYSCSLIETSTEDNICLPAVGCAFQDRYDYPLYVANKHLNWMSPEILQQVRFFFLGLGPSGIIDHYQILVLW